ncbi:MAG: polyprenyl synthetase family protein [Candidatus Eisenbacteria bacterium]|uniref:Polyprenyl synthetase family protein n=1 Tax=Eiseniibacteriota bacterium TaxID=2212470 RepID=A0A948RVQ3_UNCEI|nr:polyprenyl synthetase family protein [Candidatus Eisenbacteria bacterium]MBU1949614.1 polyprenyl synthetase family protein [Candidatus Eisenbacteria bacterium]MBU2690362.1 polyprenyl synthetase family protein [Candidatus Eisenbacteria bacterium]
MMERSKKGVADPAGRAIKAFDRVLLREKPKIETALRSILPRQTTAPQDIHRAMHYMIFPGGKRLRPLMVLMAHRTFGGRHPKIYQAAGTVELIHAFSLVHDDLPCMDDDDFRRGRPSCHRAFGEAKAVLAGDALLVQAFQTLGSIGAASLGGPIVEAVAAAIGTTGVIGGQTLDLESEGKEISPRVLATIHARKTAALFVGCLQLGALLAKATPAQIHTVSAFGESFGLAFQVADDLLNLEGDFATLGRPRGTDLKHQKATYPRILGQEKTYEHLRRMMRMAVNQTSDLGSWGEVYRGLVLKAARRVPGWTVRMERGIF